ncbi:MAG: hypothetical protein IJU59_01140 [Firmicutes bacterium]|nr:hypothetical protein [Bacillota bacterium]
MKKILMAIFVGVFVFASITTVFAEAKEVEYSKVQSEQLAKDAMMNSLNKENFRLTQEIVGKDTVATKGDIGESLKAASNGDGIHVATRRSKSSNYKEIQTMFKLGINIGTDIGASVYFMHYFGNGTISVDSGIYYTAGRFSIFHYGTINAAGGWNDNNGASIGIYAGDTVYVNSKISGRQITTTVMKNGRTVATLTDTLKAAASGAGVAREFNIASHNPINSTATYFSWSEAQSSMTTTSNELKQMDASNSKLDSVYYDKPSANHSSIGFGRDAYSSGGFIYDKAWCRCNYR